MNDAIPQTPLALQSKGFLRLPRVLKLIPVSASTWWRWCADGTAPKPIKLGKNTTVWRAEEIQAFLDKYNQEGK